MKSIKEKAEENCIKYGNLGNVAYQEFEAGAIGTIKTLIDHKDDENAYFKVFLRNNTIHIGVEDICSDDIKPIPIKRIHLAKNGFKADEKDEIFTYYEGYKVIVDFDDIFGGNAYLRIDFADKHLDIEIEYLHELQQAMRIMGCDKTIEL